MAETQTEASEAAASDEAAPEATPTEAEQQLADAPGHGAAGHEVHHPNPSAYVGIAFILAVATAAEIALFYLEDEISSTLNVVSLLVLMVVKFFLVAAWFMHLRFESKIFRRLFYGGVVLATLAYAVVLAASHVFPFLV